MNNKYKKFNSNRGIKPHKTATTLKKNTPNFSKNINLKKNQIIISGKHSTLSALKNTNRKLFYLISTPDHYTIWIKEVQDLGIEIDIKIKEKDELDEINNFKPHQNIILIAEKQKRVSLDEFLMKQENQIKKPTRIIILDQVTDPQNVGAIIRSAYAFKMDGLAMS